ncbi:MAG: leucine-rich repeat domain-containing protein, partial [Coriobacteriia bacterium]|nr:leucine-rich repeat domain-containing protein [Coriobacteriia bacterium]
MYQRRNVLILTLITLVILLGIGFGNFTGAAGTWAEEDFTVAGNTITGFSATGLEKVATDKELLIPDITGVTAIGNNAFQANSLTLLELPASIADIGEYAFADNQLTGITLPGVVTIGANSFRANRLSEVTLPSSVTSIATDAFDLNGRVVAIHTTATGLVSSFSVSNGFVVNPVTVTVYLTNADDDSPIGDGIKLLGTNFNSAELFPAGTNVTINAPSVAGWTAQAPTTQTINNVQAGASATFAYEHTAFAPIITVNDKSF